MKINRYTDPEGYELRKRQRQNIQLEGAMRFLRSTLSGGPLDMNEVWQSACRQGISRNIYDQAIEALGVLQGPIEGNTQYPQDVRYMSLPLHLPPNPQDPDVTSSAHLTPFNRQRNQNHQSRVTPLIEPWIKPWFEPW